MEVQDLRTLAPTAALDVDLVIVGSGPAGLTLAQALFGTPIRVLVVESGGLRPEAGLEALDTVEWGGPPPSDATVRRRMVQHEQFTAWSHAVQPFGVRSRGLGGSSQVWAGRCATFADIDFARRDWVPHSGWPVTREALAPFVERAADVLNLGPNCYDEGLWPILGVAPPEPPFDPALFGSFFWQFARSRRDKLDAMRFGDDFQACDAPNVRVLLHATVVRIDTNDAGTAVTGVEVSTIDGVRRPIRARAVVLAAGAIENPRLLLVSNQVQANGLGNQHDVVGRFLMDHPTTSVGQFRAEDYRAVIQRFGFYGLRRSDHAYLYHHGLVPTAALQERERLVHCALYVHFLLAPDDPVRALKRLLGRDSKAPLADLLAVARGPGLLAKAIGVRLLQHDAFPDRLRTLVVETMVKRFPNFVVQEYLSGNLPHKLTGIRIDVIAEQCPDPDSRITLSARRDALGVPMAKVDWRVDAAVRHSMLRMGQLFAAELQRLGLPAPRLEEWVVQNRPEDAIVIDNAHTCGTTRMSDDPRTGVVDADCQVHGVAGLYIAGSSIFPTAGHANPTLMILAFALRLADHLEAKLIH